jgi:hypothetical protein
MAWVIFRSGLPGTLQDVHWPGTVLLYFLECLISVPFAFAVFKIFIAGGVTLRELWPGSRKYGWKAMGLSILSGSVMALGTFNIRFYLSVQGTDRFPYLLLASFVFSILVLWVSMAVYQWPLLFFQDPPFRKIVQRSFFLVMGGGFFSLGVLVFLGIVIAIFFFLPFLWFFAGPVLLFSFQSVALEKKFLRYRITFQDKPLGELMAALERERQRGWRDLLKPWESR